MCPITSIFGRRTLLHVCRAVGATARCAVVAVAKSSEHGLQTRTVSEVYEGARNLQTAPAERFARRELWAELSPREAWRHVFARRRAGEAPPGARRELKDRLRLPASAPREDILSSSA